MVKRSTPVSEALKFLDNIRLFSDLDEKSMDVLARASRFQRVKKGKILFFQSDPWEFAYVVRSGEKSIVLSSPDGRDMVINRMRPGNIFGELGILTAQPRSTSAIARADSDILVIPREAFLGVVDAEPSLARRILKITFEVHTKVLGKPILIEGVTRSARSDASQVESHDLIQFKGKTVEVEVFSVPVGERV
jgi:CRP-like cAMP-binding protein